jgi:alpha-L-arabinofuranosidase
LLASAPTRAFASALITIPTDFPGVVVNSNLFGVFFEEISFAGEGGLYAEMVRNRSLGNSANPDYWTLVTQGTATGQMTVDTSRPLNTNSLRSLKLTMQSGAGSVGAGNAGFWGMSLLAGSNYDLSFFVQATNGFTGPISARLESASGSTLYAQTSFNGLTTNWQRLTASLVPNATDVNARFVLSISQPGTVWLDCVSLFPRATYRNRTNGLRGDLAGMVAAVQPSFMRYPGGNFIEAANITNAVRWKTTIGDIAARPGHLNDAWNYWSTDGFGLHEFLLLCEDLGMEPLYGINCGLALGYNGNTNNTVPMANMGPWVQDALDLIQYANGDTNTTWGAQRAANGHPAPFNLKYLEIGNESGGAAYYDPRYALFYDAIKSNYPNIHLIAPLWGGIPANRPVEIQDEHYYTSPDAFVSYATKYDSYSRSGPKVFVGEYAVTSGFGTLGNLSAALGEAAFMTGMERNSDVVLLASYAPLLQNVNFNNWRPDAIYYDSYRFTGTPSYYVQRMFGQHRGDAVLPATVAFTPDTNAVMHGSIGVGSWNTSVQYSNIVVTSNGVTLYQSDFVNQGTNGWRVHNGTWSTNAGYYQQTSATTTDCRSTTGDTNWANYTLTLRARKVSGSEGFLILFNWLDDNNLTWWNIGGWNNTLDGIEQMVGGSKTLISPQIGETIQTNQWYDIRVVLTGPRVQCYLNGNLVQDITYASSFVASCTYAKASGQVIVKAVNPGSLPVATTFQLTGLTSVSSNATLIQLTSGSASDENSLASPTYVFPVTNQINNAGTNFSLTLPANSLSILRLQTAGIASITNIQLQLASPINVGQIVPSTLWAWKTGQSSPFNLATNSNTAITWTSLNPAIASVDISGAVSGISAGTTSIIATYGALGLSSTQVVQVLSKPTVLVHRYSFSESPGSTIAADSIGGAAWNGALPNGGTYNTGQLALAAASHQFVQLPSGILSNYTAVTIETWATFPTALPTYCFLFGFGNTNGVNGTNYIFCSPSAGRIAITAGTYSDEQNAFSSSNFSLRTNLHITAVFNPPAGYLALYTNGILAGINNAITVRMSSVNDVFSYIGRSLFINDPYPDLTLDEFRIYNGALHADEISATQVLGPTQLLSLASPLLIATASVPNLTLSWPVASAGFTLQSRTNLTTDPWTAITNPAPQLIGNQWQVTLPMTNAARYYRMQK